MTNKVKSYGLPVCPFCMQQHEPSQNSANAIGYVRYDCNISGKYFDRFIWQDYTSNLLPKGIGYTLPVTNNLWNI